MSVPAVRHGHDGRAENWEQLCPLAWAGILLKILACAVLLPDRVVRDRRRQDAGVPLSGVPGWSILTRPAHLPYSSFSSREGLLMSPLSSWIWRICWRAECLVLSFLLALSGSHSGPTPFSMSLRCRRSFLFFGGGLAGLYPGCSASDPHRNDRAGGEGLHYSDRAA